MKIDFSLCVPLAYGVLLGFLYFYAMWYTVSKLPTSKNPAKLLIQSALIRMTFLFPAFYLIMDNQFERIIACLIGFIATRTAAIRYTKLSLENIFNSKSASKMEQNNAS